jgi:glycosyltransferase involved in cell wall biosynthesis
LRFGIDAHIVGTGKGGVERFLREMCVLLPQIGQQHRFVIFASKKAIRDGEFSELKRAKLVEMPFSKPALERALVLPALARIHRLDALLVQRIAPWPKWGFRVVLTVHDLTPIKLASQYGSLRDVFVRLLTRVSVLASDLVLTPCEAVAEEVATYAGQDRSKFVAYFNGVDRKHFAPSVSTGKKESSQGIESSYLLACGAIERRKCVETLIKAYAEFGNSRPRHLVVIGSVRDPDYAAELRSLVSSVGLAEAVDFRGFVTEQELVDLYRNATVFVAASSDEGFNMPVLEAMACQVPVICSDIAPHRELFAGAAAFFKPNDVASLTAVLRRVLADPDQQSSLKLAGAQRACMFTWEAAAQRVLGAMERSVAGQ